MKYYRTLLLSTALLFATGAIAQEAKQSKISEETTEKTYKVTMNDQVVENSVKIHTTRYQPVMLDETEKDQVNQSRIYPRKAVVKTVKIDRDADDAYDEVVKFSYITEDDKDFTLVSDEDSLLVAVEDGSNITILEDRAISKNDLNNPKKSYVFTTEDGKKIEFFIESFEYQKETM